MSATTAPISSRPQKPSFAGRSKPKFSFEDGWHLMRRAVDEDLTLTQMLQRNSALPPRVKHTLCAASSLPLIQAECRMEESAQLIGQVDDAAAASLAPFDPDTFIALCEEAGWAAERRSSGAIIIPLPGAGGRHAQVHATDNGMRLFVELPFAEDAAAATREAREHLLLTLGGVVRMVRPLLRQHSDGAECVELEVGFLSMPEADLINHALRALTVALAAAMEPLDAFADENLASQYLAIRRASHERPSR